MCAIRLPERTKWPGDAWVAKSIRFLFEFIVRHCQQALHDSHIRPKINGSLKRYIYHGWKCQWVLGSSRSISSRACGEVATQQALCRANVRSSLEVIEAACGFKFNILATMAGCAIDPGNRAAVRKMKYPPPFGMSTGARPSGEALEDRELAPWVEMREKTPKRQSGIRRVAELGQSSRRRWVLLRNMLPESPRSSGAQRSAAVERHLVFLVEDSELTIAMALSTSSFECALVEMSRRHLVPRRCWRGTSHGRQRPEVSDLVLVAQQAQSSAAVCLLLFQILAAASASTPLALLIIVTGPSAI
jgi:hypothetical protein